MPEALVRHAARGLGLLLLVAVGACQQSGDEHHFQGYVEAEPLRLGAAAAGRLDDLHVARGDRVDAKQPLFALDSESERAALTEAQARLAAAQSRLADLEKGQRPEELNVIKAQLAQAKAQLSLSTAQLARQQSLIASGAISQDQLDQTRAQQRRDQAQVAELTARIKTAELSARSDALTAAQQDVEAAAAVVANRQWALDQKTVHASAAGLVDDVYYRSGEWVAAGQPVVSVLPPGNRKLRFFVPETVVGGLRIGQALTAHCDGCAQAVSATIRYIAPSAEFTPPVLYSEQQRARLVFLVEAQPDAAAAETLHPGQPVDVELLP